VSENLLEINEDVQRQKVRSVVLQQRKSDIGMEILYFKFTRLTSVIRRSPPASGENI